MDFRGGIGSLSCRLCGANYQMPIHHLSEPVDVFSEWLDDCETAQAQAQQAASGTSGAAGYDDLDDDDDDELPESSGLGQRKPSAKPPSAKNSSNARSIDLGDEDSDDSDDDE